MRARSVGFVLAVAVSAGTALVAAQQRTPAAQIVPAGFKVTLDTDMGAAFMFEATRLNDACPKPHMNPEILVGGGRTPNPAVAIVIDMMANQPEDPPSHNGMTVSEPAGKERYRGGVLTWRTSTTPWIGAGKGDDLVMISGAWAGPGPGMLLSASVGRFCGPKEAVRGWIDGMIDRLTASK